MSITAFRSCCLDLDGISPELLKNILESLLNGVEDYTVDSRGDIGAIVRESAMSSIRVIYRYLF